jgi:hypothetical protein
MAGTTVLVLCTQYPARVINGNSPYGLEKGLKVLVRVFPAASCCKHFGRQHEFVHVARIPSQLMTSEAPVEVHGASVSQCSLSLHTLATLPPQFA